MKGKRHKRTEYYYRLWLCSLLDEARKLRIGYLKNILGRADECKSLYRVQLNQAKAYRLENPRSISQLPQ